MARAYSAGKWSGTLSANLKGDTTQNTPTLGYDYDLELKNVKTAQTKINNIITKMEKEIKKLKDDSGTGKLATYYLTNTSNRIKKIKESIDTEVKLLTNQVNSAHREEDKRFKEIIRQWAAAQGIKF